MSVKVGNFFRPQACVDVLSPQSATFATFTKRLSAENPKLENAESIESFR